MFTEQYHLTGCLVFRKTPKGAVRPRSLRNVCRNLSSGLWPPLASSPLVPQDPQCKSEPTLPFSPRSSEEPAGPPLDPRPLTTQSTLGHTTCCSPSHTLPTQPPLPRYLSMPGSFLLWGMQDFPIPPWVLPFVPQVSTQLPLFIQPSLTT